MSQIDEITRKYLIGYAIFEQLCKLSDKELLEKLKSVLGGHKQALDILNNKPGVERRILNERYESVFIYWYGRIEISACYIFYKPEHGDRKVLVEFNEHFKL